MKDDLELESLLRNLRPQGLPADLRARMDEPPFRRSGWKGVVVPVVFAAAAVWVFFLALPSGVPQESEGVPPITIRQQQSSLIDSRVVAVIEHEGQAWELTEEEWLDQEIAICSSSPVQVRLAETRHELVYHPVEFF